MWRSTISHRNKQGATSGFRRVNAFRQSEP
jgi:hypothetical protein